MHTICTPEIFWGDTLQEYIQSECKCEQKQWVYQLICDADERARQPAEPILINDDKWILCHNFHTNTKPDESKGEKNAVDAGASEVKTSPCVSKLPKQCKTQRGPKLSQSSQSSQISQSPSEASSSTFPTHKGTPETPPEKRYLVIFKNLELRTMRDLRSEHVEMLQDMQQKLSNFLRQQHGKLANSYRIFFHYLPSVFQLHAHVSARRISFNSYRRHYLFGVLRNLKKDDRYYQDAMILTVLTPAMRKTQEYVSLLA